MERYLHYLKNVLGIKSVLTQSAESPKLYIYVQNLETYSESEKELFNKMMTAMKLSKNDYVIQAFDSTLSRNIEQVCIYLLDQPQENNNDETYSPRVLLKQPEFKKAAWEALQRVMLKFSKQ